jgi:hypothetical protein
MVVAGMTSRMQRIVDRVVSPETRSGFYENVWAFFQEQPVLAVCSTSFLFNFSIDLSIDLGLIVVFTAGFIVASQIHLGFICYRHRNRNHPLFFTC